MRLRVTPGGKLSGEVVVPGDKSIAHRWVILSATAVGRSRLVGVPASLDVRSTASCISDVAPGARPGLEAWTSNDPSDREGHGSTWNGDPSRVRHTVLEVEGEGRWALVEPSAELDCGNSGTAMRLLAGLLAATPVRSKLVGDHSLSIRPMERVALPLREMGAEVTTTEGHAPIVIEGGALRGIRHEMQTPSAQVKGAVLLAGVAGEGETTVVEPIGTRDHTERALAALGGPVRVDGTVVSVARFQHEGFTATVPGDASSAAFLVSAAALTGSELTIRLVGLNPSRLRFLDVLARMGVRTEVRIEREELAEPVGDLWVAPCDGLVATEITADELPLVIDEVPMLALVASHARGDTWFVGAGELRVKESDRLSGLADGIVGLGGHAGVEHEDLVVAGVGLRGGTADAHGDHRLAMAFAIGGLAANAPSTVSGIEAAEVSFPGFTGTLKRLGATVELAS